MSATLSSPRLASLAEEIGLPPLCIADDPSPERAADLQAWARAVAALQNLFGPRASIARRDVLTMLAPDRTVREVDYVATLMGQGRVVAEVSAPGPVLAMARLAEQVRRSSFAAAELMGTGPAMTLASIDEAYQIATAAEGEDARDRFDQREPGDLDWR